MWQTNGVQHTARVKARADTMSGMQVNLHVNGSEATLGPDPLDEAGCCCGVVLLAAGGTLLLRARRA